MKFTIKQGMNQDILKQYPDNHFDSIVTDPPYGIEFLGKDWDKNTGAIETWEECLRVLKPGGHLLAFSAARTYHHLATNIESVGFEIRDQIMWIYGSGFPKAQDIGKAIDKRAGKTQKRPEVVEYEGSNEVVGKLGSGHGKCSKCNKDIVQARKDAMNNKCSVDDCEWTEVYKPADNEWAGWKTALKPAHEPIVVARKPFKGSTVDNVLEHGTGAYNIDECRIPTDDVLCGSGKRNPDGTYTRHQGKEFGQGMMPVVEYDGSQGRFPSNVIGEIPEYQKYFYCPKVSRKERHIGLEDPGFTTRRARDEDGNVLPYRHREEGEGVVHFNKSNIGNNHPTVKPVELMKYLIKLVTPKDGIVLDPFNGSGSTGMAAVELGYEYVGCELDPAYVAIAEQRIRAWYEHTRPESNFGELFE